MGIKNKIFKQLVAHKQEKAKEEFDRREALYENVYLTIYDVVRMTDDDFTKLSALPNYGNITVMGKDYSYSVNLATAIRDYNLNLYEKYKLLLDDYEYDNHIHIDKEKSTGDEEDYYTYNNGQTYKQKSTIMKSYKGSYKAPYKPSYLETYEESDGI